MTPLEAFASPLLAHPGEPLSLAGMVMEFAEGREICSQGGETGLFYRVTAGVVRVCRFLDDGHRQIQAFPVAGDLFGLELDQKRRLAAEAVTDCSLVAYRRHGAQLLAGADLALARQLFHHAMEGLAGTQNHALLLGRRRAAEKLAAFLLDWQARAGDGESLYLPMSRQDIADYLGLTIETVSRGLSQFERDGILALSGARRIHILKPAALHSLTR
jgi:CRP/FNR family nitrogen fixation transcriptional regulator